MEIKTLNDLLDLAIKVEQGSQNFYKAVLPHANDDKTKNFLRELYEEELQHERALGSSELPKEINYQTIAKAAL